jgi:hypothetical protein
LEGLEEVLAVVRGGVVVVGHRSSVSCEQDVLKGRLKCQWVRWSLGAAMVPFYDQMVVRDWELAVELGQTANAERRQYVLVGA